VVVSPAKAIPIAYDPALVGALVFTEATPELFVRADSTTPARVNVTVFRATAAPESVVSVALSVMEERVDADVDPE
jgi:hypothetical protein